MAEQRRALVFVSGDLLAHILDLPESIRVVSVKADWERCGVQLMVEGDGLDAVAAGMLPPALPGTWEYAGDEQRPRFVPDAPLKADRG
ncbi:hypothetical protein ACGFIY_21255 [Micromonospora chersina]|uniref:hypothetical protein n=1 Tax=Micromonospora chersina TaxID=47854 RepID=UPI00371BAF72